MATKYVFASKNDHPYRIVLKDGRAFNTPIETDDEDIVEELREYVKHHAGMFVLLPEQQYLARKREAAAKAEKEAEAKE